TLLGLFLLTIHGPVRSTLFPYTTLFRSRGEGRVGCGGLGVVVPADPVDLGDELDAVGEPLEAPQRRADPVGGGSAGERGGRGGRSEEHTSELQSRENLVCRLLLE